MENSAPVILARTTILMLLARIANNERLMRCYLIENGELREMIRRIEREIDAIAAVDPNVTIRNELPPSPPPLRRQHGGMLNNDPPRRIRRPMRDITNLTDN